MPGLPLTAARLTPLPPTAEAPPSTEAAIPMEAAALQPTQLLPIAALALPMLAVHHPTVAALHTVAPDRPTAALPPTTLLR